MFFFSFYYKRVSRLGGQKQSAVLSQPVAVVCSVCLKEGASPFSIPAKRRVLTFHLHKAGEVEKGLAIFSPLFFESALAPSQRRGKEGIKNDTGSLASSSSVKNNEAAVENAVPNSPRYLVKRYWIHHMEITI